MAGSNDSYNWIGGASGSWSNPANWSDVTSPGSAGSVPGSTNSATIATSGATITGSGRAALLNITAPVTFSGTFQTGTLNAAISSSSSAIQITGGTFTVTQNVTGYSFGDPAGIDVTDSTFTVDGTFAANAEIYAYQSGQVQLANVTAPFLELFGDASSSIEIGTAGGAAAGAITVDAGASVTTYGEFAALNIINNGTIAVSGGQTLYLVGGSPASNGTTGAFTIYTATSATLSGTGQIDIGAGSTLDIVSLNATASAKVAFTGSHGTLSVSGINAYQNGPASFGATISGFDSSDIIQFQGLATSAAYSNGVLALFDGTTNVADFNLSGNYAGDVFKTVIVNGSETDIEIATNPSVTPPVINALAALNLQYGVATAIAGVSISDSDANFIASGGYLTVVLTDTYGALSVNSSVAGGG